MSESLQVNLSTKERDLMCRKSIKAHPAQNARPIWYCQAEKREEMANQYDDVASAAEKKDLCKFIST